VVKEAAVKEVAGMAAAEPVAVVKAVVASGVEGMVEGEKGEEAWVAAVRAAVKEAAKEMGPCRKASSPRRRHARPSSRQR